ncbi:phosphoribosylformylglycinamidine cyclo-ligase [Pleomorphochaeta sp. DL1XJH-081]|uniref:phosphoribosylformylglycinamidine cyclo-ligase n=1 Tax=Pleomorphochaeta sp. DL1XJH-081 TaxID=3409690 RepID=UPI003BB68B24
MSEAYKAAGVSLQSGYESIERIRKHIATTASLGFNGDIGGFGGLFNLFKYGYEEPVLVSGTDGVGTKLLLAITHGKIDTVGIDLVAMCVNDILTVGAEPLFFLDYIAVGKNRPEDIEKIVSGIATGCRMGNLSLIGGETAEMPGMYVDGHFDLAGFAVGVVERNRQITGSAVAVDDVLIGIPSSGVHSNGYSLVRKILQDAKADVSQPFGNSTLLEHLMEPTRIYVDVIGALRKEITIHAMSHITGGGYHENLPRMVKDQTFGIELDLRDVHVPAIFEFLMEKGNLTAEEMYHIFNMGIGFVIVVPPDEKDNALRIAKEYFPESCVIGKITRNAGVHIR